MGAISLDEYKKRRQSVQQDVSRPNTILFSDYNAKYGNQKLPTEVTRAGNSFLLPTIEQPKAKKQEEQYIDTGKTYGDYWYQEYGKRKDDKIYSKGGKYYVLNSRTGEYDDVDRINYMTTEELDKKQLEEAQSLGYKGNKADLAKISNKILLDTGNLTKKEYADYSKDLKRQEEKLNKEQAEKTKIRYSGTGIDALKQIGTKASDVAYTADKEIIAPIKNAKENYNIGKKNNELAIEYYKKMEGKKNNAKELEEKQQKFNRYNQDLITNPGAAGTAIQNMNTQVESLKGQTVASGLLALLGGAVGFGVGGAPGAVAGAKAGASIGYTFGGTPYTYKLEAGNQYKDLIEQGIPKNIAKDLSRKTGAINAAIESGENVLDIITFGRAGKLKNAAEQELYNQLKKEYGEKALKTLLIKTGYSYAQNILSESAEEMAQEGTSIHYEREAYKNAKLDRPVTTEEDINRILEAGKSAAVSTAFTAPVTSFGGSLVTNIVDNLQTQAIQKVNTLTNSQINNEIATAITNVSNENNTNLTTEEILTIQQQVKNDLNGKNITIIDDTNTQTKEQIQNRIASLKEDLQTYETFTNEATRTESETREINNIKQEIKNLQQELKQQNNIPTVQDLVNQERNNQNLKLPTRELTFAEEVKKNNINMNNESVQSIQNMLENRNIKFSFDEKAFDNNSIESLWRESIDNNGNIIREVIFNPNATDSNKYLQNLAIHELYHDISNSQQGQSIKTELLDYVSRIDGYKEARTALESTYSKLYDSTNPNFENMVNDEVVAHILGQKLGNQQFVNSLSYQQPSIARQIYNWVIDKLNSLNKLVGYRSEKIFWSDVKNKFDNAYRTQYNSSQQLNANQQINSTKFAATRENNPYGHVKSFVDLDAKTQEEAHRVVDPKAKLLHNKGKSFGSVYDINGNLYDFEIFSDGTYRITEVELYNPLVEEVTNEKYTETDSRYSVRGAIDGQSNDDVYNESNRNRKTSQENVRISTEESEQQSNNGYRLLNTKQEKNNSRELNDSSLSLSKNSEIQGMKVTKSQVEDAVYSKFDSMSSEYGFDVDEVEGVYLHGSRLRGTANQNSDLDAVVFYIGNESEDYIFNTINDDNNQLVIDGVKVDINPVSIDSLSEIDDYIAKSEAYDKEVLSKRKRKTNNLNEYIEDVATREAIQNKNDRQSVRESITSYLEEHDIKNPTKEDMMNAMDWYEGFDASEDLTEIKKAEKLYSEVADELLKEKKIPIKQKEVKDSKGRTLSKQQQLDIINKSNPADDEIHTWIRSTDDIKTFEEAFFEDGEYSGMDPDFTEEMANDSLKSGEITVYSSNPIENGTFVSPSQMEASQYAGGDASKLHSKTVNINDVAWIDGAEGQYAKVDNNTNSSVISTKDNQGRTLSKQQQDFFKDSKVRDENGNLMEVYHGTNTDFTTFDKSYLGSASGDLGFLGDGFYFATHKGESNYYGSKNMSVYLNVKNPYNIKNLQDYKGMHLRGENSNPYVEIKNLVDMNQEWANIELKYGYTYGDIANNLDNYFNKIKIEEAGIDANGYKQFKIDTDGKISFVSTVNNYTIEELIADTLYNEMRNEFGYINGSDILQNITSEAQIRKINNQDSIKTFSDILQEQGYDGIIQGDKVSDTDEIVVFNPNQIKNVDNLNPTTNNDIRFSKNNKSWDKFVESNFKTEGTGERLQDVLLPTKDTMKYSASTVDDNLRSLEANAPAMEEEQIAPVKKITTDPTKESSYDDADLPNFWELNKNKKSNLDNEIDEFKRAVDRQLQEEITTPKQIKRNNTLKSQLSDMYSRFQEQFINRNHEIDKYSKLTGNKEIMYKGDMLNNVAGEVTGDINIGQTDNYGKQIGESLNSLFKNAKKKGYYDQFDDYLKHYSNIDRHGYGKGSVVPLDYSQKMVKAYEKSIPGIKNEATKVWQYGKNMLSNMEENGLISKDFKETLEDMYPHYVPYMQSDSMVPYMDDSGEIKPKKVIKRAEGKAHDLITVEEALEKYTYAHKKAIRQNDLYKEIVKTSKEKISIGADDRADPTQLNNSLGHDMEGNGFLTAYVDGNMQQAQISDALYQELAKTNELRLKDAESKYAPILKPLQKISEIRRNILTTWNPSFLLTNSIKDIQDGLLNSKYTKDMVKNYPGAFYELATQSTDTARQFSSLYGSGMVMGEYQVDRLTNSTKNLDIKQVNKIMQTIPNLNEIIELTPRYAEFKASLEHGTSVTEAMYNARELTTNFGRGGYITKALNRNGFTFLNASVQGFDKMIRNFTGANGSKGIAVSVTGTLMKVVALGVAPALFNATAFGAGDDDEDEAYKALPNYIKDNYYLFKVKGLGNKTSKYYDGTFLRIPKGRVLSVFGSAARRTLEFTKGDKNAFDGYLKNVDSQIGINNPEENNIFAPIKQAFGSKNGEAWYGGDIIPKRLQNKPAAEQYDESTDEFSKWLGKTLNISPYKINYLVDQYSGGGGDIVLPMITKETTNGATTVPDYLLAPLKDKFIVNSTDDNKYASNFYSSLEKAQTKANGEKAKVEDKLKYKYMSSISSDMSKLYKEKREIQLDDSLTKKQKYKKVQNVQKEINRLAEEGIKDYKVKDLKSNYGKIANKEYYKNNKNEWSVIKDEESADLNSMRMTSNEKNNYFIAKNKISNIKQQDIDSKIKKSKISDIVLKTNLSDEKMAYLYGKYYSKEETLDIIQDAGISIKEFIKFDSQDIESDYYANGKAVPNSKKKKTIAYINSLNLSAIQKAMLIRMEYSSFTSYDRQIIQYVNNQKLNSEDKKAIYEKLGFKIRNGRVYSK